MDCSRSWFWRALRLETSKTPPELVSALFEIVQLLSEIAKHDYIVTQLGPRLNGGGKGVLSEFGQLRAMEGEHNVFAHEIEPERGVRIVATGVVDAELIDAADMLLMLQLKRVGIDARRGKDKTEE